MDTSKVTRIEVIDHSKPLDNPHYGRDYTFWSQYDEADIPNPIVRVELQDKGRTLKVFISKEPSDDDKREIEDFVADSAHEQID